MPEPLTTLAAVAPLFARSCGKVAGRLLQKAAEKHVESFFGRQLHELAKLGKKDEVVEAAQKAYALWFEWMLKNVQSLGYDEAELEASEEAAEKLLDDEAVFVELLKPVHDSRDKPDRDVFQDAWERHDCPSLPEGFSWTAALNAYQRQVEKQKIGQDSLREKQVAELLSEIRDAQTELVGVRPEVSERRYARRMREKYQVLDLGLQNPPMSLRCFSQIPPTRSLEFTPDRGEMRQNRAPNRELFTSTRELFCHGRMAHVPFEALQNRTKQDHRALGGTLAQRAGRHRSAGEDRERGEHPGLVIATPFEGSLAGFLR